MDRSVEDSVAPVLSASTRSRLRLLARTLGPRAGRLRASFERRLRSRRYSPAECEDLMALVPASAAVWLGSGGRLSAFLGRARAAARRLALSHVPPAEVLAAARECDRAIESILPGVCKPAREQYLLAISILVNQAYYEAREAEVRRLSAAARHAEEEERKRIGRELHDEAGQSLLLLRLKLESLGKDAPAPFRQEVAEAREIAGQVIVELRRLISALGPSVLERVGIRAALRHLGARFRKQSSAMLRMSLTVPQGRLPRQVEEVIYRVAQEALQNISRHAAASHVNLSLRVADKSIRLRIGDDGSGFDEKSAVAKAGSFGLAGMKERAALLGGRLDLRTAPGAGTVLVLTLPRPAA